MEGFISGLATGIALILIRSVPALTKRPGLIRYFLRDGAGAVRFLGLLCVAASAGWMFGAGFSNWHAMAGLYAGAALMLVPTFLRDALAIAENVSREEANEGHRQRAAAKAAFKPYEPLRVRRRW